MNSSLVTIRREVLTSSTAELLIRALNDELDARYPEEGANHFELAADEVADGHGAFFVAYAEEVPIGCGAIRRIEPSVGEIKRMYVAPSKRGRGVGYRLLAELEAEARRLGLTRLLLETGARQPEAQALYAHAGFTEIPRFGQYIDSPLSVCMAKLL